jgi:group I intron endonuclease
MESNYTMSTVFYKKDFDFSCIYKLTSPSGKIYIGQAQSMYKRFQDYRRPRATKYLKRAILKYGLENMKVEILERDIPLDKLDKREQFYLDTLQPFGNNGYNICREASTTRGRKRPPEEMVGLSEYRKKRVGKLNSFFGKTHTEEAKQKIRESRIGKKLSEQHIEKIKEKTIRCVKQVDVVTKEVIAEYESIKEAENKTGIKSSNISKVANKIKSIKEGDIITYSAGEYLWIFCDFIIPSNEIKVGTESIYKCVKQIDLISGDIIEEFKSVKEASLITNISYATISKVANKSTYTTNGKKVEYKSAGGFYWEFC